MLAVRAWCRHGGFTSGTKLFEAGSLTLSSPCWRGCPLPEVTQAAWHALAKPSSSSPDRTHHERPSDSWSTFHVHTKFPRLYHRGSEPGAHPTRSATSETAKPPVSVYVRDPSRARHFPKHKEKHEAGNSVQGGSVAEVLRESGWTRQEVINVPNALSVGRALSGPLIYSWILDGQWDLVLPGLAVAGLSDWADGYAARRLNQTSVLGSYLDPIGDKILVGFVALGMMQTGLLPMPLACLIVGRDIGLVIGGFVLRARSLRWRWPGLAGFFRLGGSANAAAPMEPLFISKLNTVFQLSLVAACAIQGATQGAFPPPQLLYGLGVATAGTTIWSAAAYLRVFLGISTGGAPTIKR